MRSSHRALVLAAVAALTISSVAAAEPAAQALVHRAAASRSAADLPVRQSDAAVARARGVVASAPAAVSLSGASQVVRSAGGATSAAVATVDPSMAIVVLRRPAVAESAALRPNGRKLDLNTPAVRSHRADLARDRAAFASWLRGKAPRAQVVWTYDLVLNGVAVELNGTSLETLRGGPNVASVEQAGLKRLLADDPDLALVSAFAAWEQLGGTADAGAGVKVGIIDSGIDITHPCFDDTGYTAQTPMGDERFTNDKVIVARVFYGRNRPGYTAEGLQSHGTHVSGTIACNNGTAANVDGAVLPFTFSGIAPRALLGNYNVFPGDDSSGVDSVSDPDLLAAMEAATADGMDVVNMSLGGLSKKPYDRIMKAVDNMDALGIVVAVAAGNSGPGPNTAESPGSAKRALTAGAAAVGFTADPKATINGTSYFLYEGGFGTGRPTYPTTKTLHVQTAKANAADVTSYTDLYTACNTTTALEAGALTEAAVIARGGCTFSEKLRNVQAAGYGAAVVVNNQAGVIYMGDDGTANQPTIPAWSVDTSAAMDLGDADGASVAIQVVYAPAQQVNDQMADFSSRGPTNDERIKPDVVAPGENVVSAVASNACATPPCFAFYAGTSMATPHLAGTAALLRAAHPSWTAAQVRSAIVNTADTDVLTSETDGTTKVYDPNTIGSGRLNVHAALNGMVFLDPVSVSFGTVRGGTALSTVDYSGPASSFEIVGASDASVQFAVDSHTASTVTVSVTVPRRSAVSGGHWATLLVKDGGGAVLAHAALWVAVP